MARRKNKFTLKKESEMKHITQGGYIHDQKDGEITSEQINEKEILIDIAAKLYSIRGVMKFFTTITAIALGVLIILQIVNSVK